MPTTFQKSTETTFAFGAAFAWSASGNWSAGIPIMGGTAVIAPATLGGSIASPDSFDDLTALTLNQLTLGNAAVVGVGGSLTVQQLLSTASLSLFADSLLTGQPATLTIGSFGVDKGTNPVIQIGAVGQGAVTTVNGAPSNASQIGPAVEYEAAAGGTVVLGAAQTHDTPQFFYDTAPGLAADPAATGFGTFAFTAAALTGPLGSLNNVGYGDVLELPGNSVTSVTIAATSITVVTDLSTTSFAVASYAPGRMPTQYEVRKDAVTGLEAITLIATAFTATAPLSLWSSSADWTNGVPQPGGNAQIQFAAAGVGLAKPPTSVDDIPVLSLSSLQLNEKGGVTAVSGTLTVGTLFTDGGLADYLIADTELPGTLASASASLTIGALSSGPSGVALGAIGAGAVTRIEAGFLDPVIDTNIIYYAGDGGEVIFDAMQPGMPTIAFVSGEMPATFAFKALPTSLASISAIALGDRIELPGTVVRTVTYTPTSIVIDTDAGELSAPATYSGSVPTGFTSTLDPATGLVAATFISATPTTFQQPAQTSASFNVNWSNAANWTNGVPQSGGVVTIPLYTTDGTAPDGTPLAVTLSTPSSFDDPASPPLALTSLTVASGDYLAVGANLTVATLMQSQSFIYSDSLLGGAPASLTISAIANVPAGQTNSVQTGSIGALGPQAVTWLDADGTFAVPGSNPQAFKSDSYFVSGHGTLVFGAAQAGAAATTRPAVSFSAAGGADDVGTVAFTAAGVMLAPGVKASTIASFTGFGPGDALEVPGSNPATTKAAFNVPDPLFPTSTQTIAITTDAGTFYFRSVYVPTTYAVSMDAATGLEKIVFDEPACFLQGTRLLTAEGTIAVEQLQIGQHIVTATGRARPIRWIGRRAYSGRIAANTPGLQPIRIAAGALGGGLPTRDLFLSAKHAMFLDGVLIPAEHLVNGTSIRRMTTPGNVRYWHVELDSHDVILAEGAACETFLDDDSRAMFSNAAEYAARYPGATPAGGYCAPRVESGAQLEAVRRRLADIAMTFAQAA